jgi:hypothetical protein
MIRESGLIGVLVAFGWVVMVIVIATVVMVG